jgi:hypothetical protein
MLLDSIPRDSVSGLRDLALIAAMFYSFARVSAADGNSPGSIGSAQRSENFRHWARDASARFPFLRSKFL